MACCADFSEPPSPCSTISSNSSKNDWEMLESGLTESEIASYLKTNIPRSNAIQKNYNVKCYFCAEDLTYVTHKIKRQYRQCKESNGCTTKYRIDYCKNSDKSRIEQTGEHDHELDDTYNNANGLPLEIKKAIETILEHNPTKFPKAIRLQITVDRVKYGIDPNMKIPEIEKIRAFGDVSELSPLNLYMTTIKLLRLADGRNQNNLALYHLDGTQCRKACTEAGL